MKRWVDHLGIAALLVALAYVAYKEFNQTAGTLIGAAAVYVASRPLFKHRHDPARGAVRKDSDHEGGK